MLRFLTYIGYAQPMVEIDDLKDGLLTARAGQLREKIAIWTILVNIHQPTIPELKEVQVSEKHFDSLNRILPLRAIKIWTKRLDVVKEKINILKIIAGEQSPREIILYNNSRTKRGLFNLGGSILSSLFGLATTNQMKKYKQHIEIARKNQYRITNYLNDMTTVVNHTLIKVDRTDRVITEIKTYLLHIRDAINKNRNATNQMEYDIKAIQTELQLERLITALENMIEEYNVAWKKYFKQRSSLESGYLTEHILPRQKLYRILRHTTAMSNNMNPASGVEWYYQYTLIEPIWSKNDELIYKAEIPLVSDTQYIHYVLNSWPVPVGNHTVQLDVNADIAFDTRDGGMFYPKTCVGHNPRVCATGPVYNTKAETCIRGIVTGHRTDRHVCNMIIRKTIDKQSQIHEISTNEFIIIFYTNDNVILRCYGSREKAIKVIKGTYKVKLKENCSLMSRT